MTLVGLTTTLVAKLLLAFLLTVSVADAADIYRSDGKVFVEGYIEDGDLSRLRKTIEDGDTIVARSPGGQAFEGYRMGQLLKGMFDIHFVGVRCSSACANMAMGADKVEGNFAFHLARFPEKALATLPEEDKKYIPRMREWLVNLNSLIIVELWANHLTDEQIERIVKDESEKELVDVKFEEIHYGLGPTY